MGGLTGFSEAGNIGFAIKQKNPQWHRETGQQKPFTQIEGEYPNGKAKKKNGQHFISPRFYFSHQRNWFSVNRFFFPPWLFATHCWNKRKTIVLLYSIRVLYILPQTGICWLFVCWFVFSRQLFFFFSATNSSMQRSVGYISVTVARFTSRVTCVHAISVRWSQAGAGHRFSSTLCVCLFVVCPVVSCPSSCFSLSTYVSLHNW